MSTRVSRARRPERGRVEVGRPRFEDGRKLVVPARDDEDDGVRALRARARTATELRRRHVGERILDDDERRRVLPDDLQRPDTVIHDDGLVSPAPQHAADDPDRFGGDSDEQGLHRDTPLAP